MHMLRFATAGSVDDGKSTLIGRLLHDSKSLFDDQLAAVQAVSRARGDDYTDLSLLTDGLRAEREQGITIDVAYRYFSTPRRSFIVADTPGHTQYTRNMITGASTADLAIVLADARKGLVEQSRRHALLCTLLGVRHLVLCINKMDLVDHSETRYTRLRDEFTAYAGGIGAGHITVIPVSALHGDNIVHASTRMPWYDGPPLLTHLETVTTPAHEPTRDTGTTRGDQRTGSTGDAGSTGGAGSTGLRGNDGTAGGSGTAGSHATAGSDATTEHDRLTESTGVAGNDATAGGNGTARNGGCTGSDVTAVSTGLAGGSGTAEGDGTARKGGISGTEATAGNGGHTAGAGDTDRAGNTGHATTTRATRAGEAEAGTDSGPTRATTLTRNPTTATDGGSSAGTGEGSSAGTNGGSSVGTGGGSSVGTGGGSSVGTGARLPVQYVIRPQSTRVTDHRSYAGQIAAGTLRTGDEIMILPSRSTTRITRIDTPSGPVPEAHAGLSVTVQLADDLDISRGDLLCHPHDTPTVSQELQALICWMDATRPLDPTRTYTIKHTTRTARATIHRLHHRLDINTLNEEPATTLNVNEIGHITLRTTTPLTYDPYQHNRTMGGFILIDDTTHQTVGAGTLT